MRLSIHLMAVGHCRHCERVTRAGGSWRPISFPSISVLIIHPLHGAILYDTGYADHFMSATERFPERLYRWVTPVAMERGAQLASQLAVHGLRLSDIRWCLISHFHADHIAGLRDLTQARFICMQEDFEQIRAMSRITGLRKGLLPALLPGDFESRLSFANDHAQRPLPAGWTEFGLGHDLFGDGSLMALALPGHAPRQMGVLLRDAQDRDVLLCADACWSRQAWQALQMPMGIARLVMHEWREYRHTIERLHRLSIAHPELLILPSHCQQSLADYVGAAATPC